MARPKRLDGYSYVGASRYFLTFCVRNRRRVFVAPLVVESLLWHVRQSAARCEFSILAYCVMPDHVHLLVEGLGPAADLRKFVSRAKQHSGAAFALSQGGPLWQEGYHERVLRSSDDAIRIAKYVIENPVRAGLARCPQEYPYLGSEFCTVEELIASCC